MGGEELEHSIGRQPGFSLEVRQNTDNLVRGKVTGLKYLPKRLSGLSARARSVGRAQGGHVHHGPWHMGVVLTDCSKEEDTLSI